MLYPANVDIDFFKMDGVASIWKWIDIDRRRMWEVVQLLRALNTLLLGSCPIFTLHLGSHCPFQIGGVDVRATEQSPGAVHEQDMSALHNDIRLTFSVGDLHKLGEPWARRHRKGANGLFASRYTSSFDGRDM
jgi:hypothetical protein